MRRLVGHGAPPTPLPYATGARDNTHQANGAEKHGGQSAPKGVGHKAARRAHRPQGGQKDRQQAHQRLQLDHDNTRPRLQPIPDKETNTRLTFRARLCLDAAVDTESAFCSDEALDALESAIGTEYENVSIKPRSDTLFEFDMNRKDGKAPLEYAKLTQKWASSFDFQFFKEREYGLDEAAGSGRKSSSEDALISSSDDESDDDDSSGATPKQHRRRQPRPRPQPQHRQFLTC